MKKNSIGAFVAHPNPRNSLTLPLSVLTAFSITPAIEKPTVVKRTKHWAIIDETSTVLSLLPIVAIIIRR